MNRHQSIIYLGMLAAAIRPLDVGPSLFVAGSERRPGLTLGRCCPGFPVYKLIWLENKTPIFVRGSQREFPSGKLATDYHHLRLPSLLPRTPFMICNGCALYSLKPSIFNLSRPVEFLALIIPHSSIYSLTLHTY